MRKQGSPKLVHLDHMNGFPLSVCPPAPQRADRAKDGFP
jgi:hypothetical protein